MKLPENASLINTGTFITLILLIITAGAGLFSEGTYTGFISPLHLAESQGQDATTLFLGIPLVILAWILYENTPLHSLLLWAGAMGYFLYVNIIYAYGGVYNYLFPAYVLTCALSLYIMIALITRAHGLIQETITTPSFPSRSSAMFFIFTALMLIIMWGAMAGGGMQKGKAPDANIIIVTDFMIVIPAYVLTGYWLIKKEPRAIIYTGVLLIQAVTLGVSITAGQVIAWIKGLEPVWGLAGFFLAFTLTGSVLLVRYLRSVSLKKK